VDEVAHVRTVDAGSGFVVIDPFSNRAATTNDLLGGQVGVTRTLWDAGGNFTVEGTLKSGAYVNIIDHCRGGITDDTSGFAFVGEADLFAAYQWSHRWSFIGGYKFLAIDGLALALNQIAAPPGEINHDGDLFLNGGYLGAQLVW
jgi:hypothetical protein